MVLPCSDRISRVPPYSNPLHFNTCTGLSPISARLSRRFQLELKKHWPDPRSLATTNGVSVDVLSSRYLDVSVPWVRFKPLFYSGLNTFLRQFVIKRHCSNRHNDVRIRIVEGGFPHSEIPGSKLVRSSPRLIAAYHVLHRLSAPRHPPNALKTLDCSHDQYPSSADGMI